jgi:tetratricopeptide (TPR) repeat protein
MVAWRIVHSLKARREEAAYWVMAVAAWAPVSQVFPFYFSIADRHLYFMLPGLIGGALLWWHEGRSERGLRAWLARNRYLVAVAVGIAIVFFALRSEERAKLWQDENLLLVDAAGQYPEGGTAYLVRASQAAFAGEFDRAYEALEGVVDTGYHQFRNLALDPLLAPLRGQARFDALQQRLARLHIAETEARGLETQWKLRRLAVSHVQLGQLEQARLVLERALRMGGPVTERVHLDLEVLRELRRDQLRAEREKPPPAPGR